MSIAPEHMKKWVARLMSDVTEEGTISRFELHHTEADGRPEKLSSYALKGNGEEDAEDMAQLMFDEAEHDASTREGSSERYVLLAYRSDSQHEAQYAFRVARKNTFTGADTESPNEKGQTAQTMRILNENHTIMMRFAESIGGRLATEITRENDMRRRAEAEVASMKLALEDLKDRQLDRELLRASLLQREKIMGDVAQSLLPLLPIIAGAIIGHFSGKGEKNGKHSEVAKLMSKTDPGIGERETQLKTFFANLSAKEGESLQNAIKPMNRIALGEIYASVLKGDATMRPAIDVSIQKLLKALGADEVMAILQGLEPANQQRFMTLYKAYGELETAAQADLPDALKDAPPPPAPPVES